MCVCVERGERPLQGCWPRRAKTSENRAKLTHGDLQKDYRPIAERCGQARRQKSQDVFGRRRGCQDNALSLRGADGRTHQRHGPPVCLCTPGVNKEQSHRSTSHTCCSRLFPVRSLSVQILSEMMEAQERRPKLYTDTHSHAHSFIVIAFRHILTHCAHSQNFFVVQGRIVKIFPTRHHCLSATVFTSTTWTSCDYSSLTFFCTLTPGCLAELLFHRLTQVYEPKSEIDMAGRFVPIVDSTHDDEDNKSHMSDIPLQRPARGNVSFNKFCISNVLAS